MATEIQPSSCSSAQITFPSRLLAIPLVSSTLDTVHSTLSTSPYTQRAYTTGSSLAHSAYTTASGYATNSALYPRILPAIAAADGYANKGFDAVHAKFPYPFENSPETMYNDLKKAPEDAKNVAYKTIDERIKTPAYGLARGVDTRLTPLVDLLESILVRMHATSQHSATSSSASSEDAPSSPGASTSTDTAQVTRAKYLVFGAKDHIIELTTEQAKALREQNVYIQRAAEQAEALNATLSAHYSSFQSGLHTQYENTQAGIAAYKGKGVELTKEAQAKVHSLSQSFVSELETIQSTTASLPSQIQTAFKPLTDEIAATLTELRAVLTAKEGSPSTSVSERAHKAGEVVRVHIGPIVEKGKEVYASAVDRFLAKKHEATAEARGMTNGTKPSPSPSSSSS